MRLSGEVATSMYYFLRRAEFVLRVICCKSHCRNWPVTSGTLQTVWDWSHRRAVLGNINLPYRSASPFEGAATIAYGQRWHDDNACKLCEADPANLKPVLFRFSTWSSCCSSF